MGNMSHGEIRKCWRGIDRGDTAWVAYNFNDCLDDELGRCLPMLTYGDGAPVNKVMNLSMKGTSVKSMTGTGAPLQTHKLLPALPTKICLGKTGRRGCLTTTPIHARINHRLAALASGCHPEYDESGVALTYDDLEVAGGYNFLHIRTAADLEYLENELELTHHAELHPCCKCACSLRGDFTDFGRSAAWKPTVYTMDTWEPPAHHRFDYGGGRCIGPEFVSDDFNHCSDKGVGPQMTGSMFHEMVINKEFHPDGSRDKQIETFNVMLGAYKSENRDMVTAPYVYMADFTNPKSPHAEFPCYNPGNMSRLRCIIPFVAELTEACNSGSDHDEHRRWCAWHCAEIYDVIFKGGCILKAREVKRLNISTEAFLLHYNWLAHEAETNNIRWYKVTIKQHYLWRIAAEAHSGINPKLTMTMTGEDLVGKIATITKGSLKATRMTDLDRVVLYKYFVGLALQV